MLGAFEQAWLLLKSAFQPAQGVYHGAGMNQTVYRQKDNPDVVKVGDLLQNPAGLDHGYYNHLLSQMPSLPFFPGQSPMEQTAELPSEVNTASLPILSTQPKLDGLERSSAGLHADTVRGREMLQPTLYGHGDQGALLEAMGLSDLKRENWGATKQGIPENIVTGEPSQRLVQVHDPAFYSHLDTSQDAADSRGPAPRKLGRDYNIPAGTLEEFARTVDKNPFDDYIAPIEDSYYDFNEGAKTEDALAMLNQRQDAVNAMMASLGI
jgi:hypothetical protein